MSEPVLAVPLSVLVEVARSPYKNDDAWLWECSIAECSAGDFPPSESEARSAAVAHLESVHGIRAAEESAGEFDWTAIADQCRRFVHAHDDQHVDATILGSLLGSLRVVAGLPAVFPDDPTGIDRAARVAELERWADEFRQDSGEDNPDRHPLAGGLDEAAWGWAEDRLRARIRELREETP